MWLPVMADSQQKEREPFTVQENPETCVHEPGNGRGKRQVFLWCLFLVVLVIVVVGTAYVTYSLLLRECKRSSQEPISPACEFTAEAKRIELPALLKKLKDAVMTYHPNMIAFLPDVDEDMVWDQFKPFDYDPRNMKSKDDHSKALHDEIVALDVDEAKLNIGERKAIAQLRYFYKHTFGQPSNYYTGEWMYGPNLFCWHVICFMGNDLGYALRILRPRTLEDLRSLEKIFRKHEDSILRYLQNVRDGVQAGMVGSVEECQAGIDGFKQSYKKIAAAKNGSGVLNEWFMNEVHKDSFLSRLSKDDQAEWEKQKGKTVQESILEYITNHVGKPLYTLMRYLEDEHLRNCVPSAVSSGFHSRPLPFVYEDGTANMSRPTTGKLPSGEAINGSKSYEYYLSFFLSTDLTAEEVYELGMKQVKKIYPKIVQLAVNVTGESDKNAAIAGFKKMISSRDMYYNEQPFPANESDQTAKEKCSSVESAIKFCPQRWKAMQKWFSFAEQVMSKILPKTRSFFFFTGKNRSVPVCPVELKPDFNPSSGAPSYESSTPQCSWNCKYKIPFFLDNMGPKYTDFTTTSHEAAPGHHTQVQGATENFLDHCGGLMGWLTQNMQSYALSEGWGLYAESPLMAEETDIYENEPLQKYGMLKMQMWRALRMVVDTGMHAKGMSRQEALDLFNTYAWETSDYVQKEVTRYKSCPGQALSYMVGQLEILRLRDLAKERLGDKFNIKEFHYHVLTQEAAPLFYMEGFIKHYIDCASSGYTSDSCKQMLLSNAGKGQSSATSGDKRAWRPDHVNRRYF